MKIKPLHDRVVIQRVDEDNKTKGGIVIPDTAKEKPLKGKVVAVGPGRVSDKGDVIPVAVKAGDQVLFGKYAGTEVKIDDDEYLMMKEEDIYGVVE